MDPLVTGHDVPGFDPFPPAIAQTLDQLAEALVTSRRLDRPPSPRTPLFPEGAPILTAQASLCPHCLERLAGFDRHRLITAVVEHLATAHGSCAGCRHLGIGHDRDVYVRALLAHHPATESFAAKKDPAHG